MNFITENKGAIIFTILLMLIGSVAYIMTSGNQVMGNTQIKNDSVVFQSIRFKVAYEPDGTMHLFANSRNNAMIMLKASEGNSIPEEETIVLGKGEADKLKATGRFSRTGDRLDSYFGLNTQVEGILEKRDDIIDDMAFISAREFENSTGESNRVYAKVTKEGEPKIFFRLMANDSTQVKFKLAQGSMSGYDAHNLDGNEYYPLVIGAKEAKIMRNEKLFENTGDNIRNFFGRNFVVVGVLEETGTGIDRMHFVPLFENELIG